MGWHPIPILPAWGHSRTVVLPLHHLRAALTPVRQQYAQVGLVGIAGFIVADDRDRLWPGLLLPLLLGPFGVLAAGLLRPSPRRLVREEHEREQARTAEQAAVRKRR